MELYEIDIPKQILITMPQNERVFVINLGQFLNEINVLLRGVMFVENHKPDNDMEMSGWRCQYLYFTRILASCLYEGWKILKNAYFGSGLSRKLENEFNDETKANLTNIKKYFSSDNDIKKIRNKFGFHYSQETIDDGVKAISDSDQKYLKFILGNNRGNNLYLYSDAVVYYSMVHSLTPREFNKLIQEIYKVCDWFLAFGAVCIAILLSNHGVTIEKKPIKLDEVPNRGDVTFPFFCQ